MSKESKDKRRFARQSTNFSLEISDPAKPGRKVTALITDMSDGGMALETSSKMEIGSTLRLAIPAIIRGGVIRCEERGSKFRYGIQFHQVGLQPARREFAKPRTMIRAPQLPA